MSDALVVTEVRGQLGCITLNRAKALNSLNLDMVRSITAVLQQWATDTGVKAVAIRGMGKTGPFGNFCAGGDIRFFHQAALAGNPELDDFFTEEYTLNHLIHHYPKPYLAFMDGVVMGGGMGLSQGASVRIVTERTKMAMPETGIGLFPDVGGGYFLSRCPGHVGEYLALTGHTISGEQALAWGLADVCVPSSQLPAWWATLQTHTSPESFARWIATDLIATNATATRASDLLDAEIESAFGLETVADIVGALEAQGSAASLAVARTLRQRSPLMLHVVLEQVRRARSMSLADDLRMERDLVQHCFDTVHLGRSGVRSETVEGIRALAIDKDQQPRWDPPCIEAVTHDMVAPFFCSPWSAPTHPLRDLA